MVLAPSTHSMISQAKSSIGVSQAPFAAEWERDSTNSTEGFQAEIQPAWGTIRWKLNSPFSLYTDVPIRRFVVLGNEPKPHKTDTYQPSRLLREDLPSSNTEQMYIDSSLRSPFSERFAVRTATGDQDDIYQDIRELLSLFTSARYEQFEDGLQSEFAKTFCDLIERSGKRAIAITAVLIHRGLVSSPVAGEALKRLGEVQNETTRRLRRQVLEDFLLNNESAYIRDGALYGLVSIGDYETIGVLEQASSNEPTQMLRTLIEVAIHHLRSLEEREV